MVMKVISVCIVLFVLLSCKKEEAPLAEANFFVNVKQCSATVCQVNLYDSSSNAVSWNWFVDNEAVSADKNCTISLVQGHTYSLKLIVENSDGNENLKVKNINI